MEIGKLYFKHAKKLRDEGYSRAEISIKLNLTLNQVKYLLDKHKGGLDKKKKIKTVERFTPIQRCIIKMYQTGITAPEIAKTVGYTHNRIRSFLYENGIYKDKRAKRYPEKNIHVPFDDNERSMILEYWRDHIHYSEIAIKLKRSASSIKKEMKRLALI